MLSGMSIRHFQEWRAFADLEPFDEVRADYRSAQIVQAFYSIHRKKGAQPVKLQDCLLRFGPAVETPRSAEQARDEISRTMDFLMLIYNSPPEQPKKRAKP